MSKNIAQTTFAIIDVETTGGVTKGSMTEVCIILLKNGKILDKFTSLINPKCPIPQLITALTGIDNGLVAHAPTFGEIASKINEFTKDTVFVAHNVNFDFGFFKKEFAKVGITYSRKKLCTVRLSRKLFPGLPSYSLGKLTRSLGIPLNGAHRAEADTVATTILFQKLLQQDAPSGYQTIIHALDVKSKEATLPPHLPAAHIFSLPETPGVYLFKNKAQKVIYVGKAKNLKSRVLAHLYSKVSKEIALAQETFAIDFEETGNELTALLLESQYIGQFYPAYNKAQKRPATTYQIINYTNQKGIIQLAIGKTKSVSDSILTLYSKTTAIEKLTEICQKHALCPRFCTLQTQVEVCSHYKLKNCKGICQNLESIKAYNSRVTEAIQKLQEEKPTYIIKGKGRSPQESTLILIENGMYKGFGYIENQETITNFNDFSHFITKYKSSFHTHKILQTYHKKYGMKDILVPKITIGSKL